MAITISGSGIVEANLADNAVTLAKMASGTDGEILTYDASGNPVAVSVGTDGQVLTSTGAGSPPAFEAAAGGGAGSVLQVVTAQTSSSVHTSTNTYIDTGITATITPKFASSKIYVLITIAGLCKTSANAGNRIGLRVFRDAVQIDQSLANLYTAVGQLLRTTSVKAVTDLPNTTSATTYKLQFMNEQNAAEVGIQYDSNSGYSTIALMEIKV